MRKIVAMFLILCLSLCFCACNRVNSEESIDKHEENIDKQDSYSTEYLGVWVTTTSTSKIGPHSFQLFENGKATIHMSGVGGSVDEIPWAMAGEWMVSDNKIILFYELEELNTSYDSAYIFKIESNGNIKLNGDLGQHEREYTRK